MFANSMRNLPNANSKPFELTNSQLPIMMHFPIKKFNQLQSFEEKIELLSCFLDSKL